jgi:class 3 adenylate cyclase
VAEETNPQSPPVERGTDLRTFLIADIRGYTRYTQTFGDDAAAQLAATFADRAAEAVRAYEGEVVELRGDEALCVFVSARQAIRAGIALQRLLRAPGPGCDPFPAGVGVGIDAGEAVPVAGGYRGAALNAAARLCSAARPGEVLITATVERLAGPVSGMTYDARRPLVAKGIEKPVPIFEVVADDQLPPPPPLEQGPRPHRRRRRTAVIAAAAVVLALAVAVVVLHQRGSGSPPAAAAVVVKPDSVAIIDPHTNKVVGDVHVAIDGYPPNIAAGPGGVWTYGTTSQTLFQIDPATLHVTPHGVGVTPTNVAVGFGRVWVAAGGDKKLFSLDARSPDLTQTLRLPDGSVATSLAIGPHAVWVALASCACPSLLEVNTAGTRIVTRPRVIASEAATDTSALWVQQYLDPTVIAEVHPVSDRFTVGVTEAFPPPGYLTLGLGYAWYAAGIQLLKLTPAPIGPNDIIRLPNTARAITIAGGDVWVATDSMIIGVDPQTDTITHRIRLPHQPSGIAYYDKKLWVPIPP